MVHGITEILNEITGWPHSEVVIEDRFGARLADYLFHLPSTDAEFTVYSVDFNSEDVEEIRIRAGEKPLIVLKKEIPPTKLVPQAGWQRGCEASGGVRPAWASAWMT
jgi:hypothetical protein